MPLASAAVLENDYMSCRLALWTMQWILQVRSFLALNIMENVWGAIKFDGIGINYSKTRYKWIIYYVEHHFDKIMWYTTRRIIWVNLFFPEIKDLISFVEEEEEKKRFSLQLNYFNIRLDESFFHFSPSFSYSLCFFSPSIPLFYQ